MLNPTTAKTAITTEPATTILPRRPDISIAYNVHTARATISDVREPVRKSVTANIKQQINFPIFLFDI
jgi:hypothetical protein